MSYEIIENTQKDFFDMADEAYMYAKDEYIDFPERAELKKALMQIQMLKSELSRANEKSQMLENINKELIKKLNKLKRTLWFLGKQFNRLSIFAENTQDEAINKQSRWAI